MFPQLLDIMQNVLSGVALARRWVAFWGPLTGPSSSLIGPFLAIASVLSLALLVGIAAGALATLIIALMALYLLLTEVFGVAFDVGQV